MDNQKPKNELDIFVLTGELSGDILGFEYLKDIAAKYKVEGVLGPNLKTLPIKEFLSMERLNFMGFSKPILSIAQIISSFRKIKKRILATNPKLVLLIDLPDINLLMAKRLRKSGFTGKIFQVVCPTIWAWRPKRKRILEKYYDHLFCLFPFEKELFKDSSLKVTYTGHPLRSINPRNVENLKKIIAVFPGSRRQEVETLLPDFLTVCKQHPNYQIHISVAKESLRPTIEKICKGTSVILRSASENKDLINEAYVALSKNGTINLELALFHIPQISCYKSSRFEIFIFKTFFFIYLPHYSLPNILLQKRVIPELIGPFVNLKNIKQEFNALMNSSIVKESMLADYHRLSTHIKESSIQDPTKILTSQLCD